MWHNRAHRERKVCCPPLLEDPAYRSAKAEMQKIMVMAHSSYARAAGLQSEINKVTVTRVAGSEVECNRLLNVYRKDMLWNVNSIRREQKKLRGSMVAYTKKLRQNKKDRERRKLEELEMERRHLERNVFVSQDYIQTPTFTDGEYKQDDYDLSDTKGNEAKETVEHVTGTGSEECGDEGIVEDEDDDSGTPRRQENVRKRVDFTGVERHKVTSEEAESVTGMSQLAVIEEGNENENTGNDPGRQDVHNIAESNEEGDINSSDSGVLTSSENLNVEVSPRRKKPRKHSVSFSDLIKLQHNTSTKKLFNLVHLLAQKHGIKDPEKEKIPDTRDTYVLHGSTDGMTDSMFRAASVLYSMKYGYTVTDSSDATKLPPVDVENHSHVAINIEKAAGEHTEDRIAATFSNKSVSPRPYSRIHDTFLHQDDDSDSRRPSSETKDKQQRAENRNIRSAGNGHKRMRSMPMLSKEVTKIRMEQEERWTKSRPNRSSYPGAPPARPKFLQPIERKSSIGSSYQREDKAVSWTQALGLLKGLQNLNDI